MSFFFPRELLRSLFHPGTGPEAAPAADRPAPDAAADPGPGAAADEAARLDEFIAGLSTPDWTSHVRLIQLDSLRERTGLLWPRLEPKIELLAERLIEDEMTHDDRYLNLGGGRFLVFYRKAYLEEIRLRCLAIVEGIQEKLFGLEEHFAGHFGSAAVLAGIHAPEMNGAAPAAPGSGTCGKRQKAGSLWDLFRRDAEAQDPAEIASAAEITLDALIAEAGKNPDEAAALGPRIAHLARNLSALARALPEPQAGDRGGGAPDNGVQAAARKSRAAIHQAMRDAAMLAEAAAKEGSPEDILAALARLRRARLEEMLSEDKDTVPRAAMRTHADSGIAELVEYHPVSRGPARGADAQHNMLRIAWRDAPALAGGDPGAADLALAGEALRLCAARSAADRADILMVPVHAATLRSPTWQRRYSLLVRGGGARVKQEIASEVLDYHGAENSIALRRAIEELRANFLGVFVTLEHDGLARLAEVAAHCKEIGVHALGVDFSRLASEAAAARAFGHVVTVCRQAGLLSHVSGLGHEGLAAQALAAGLDYVSAAGASAAAGR